MIKITHTGNGINGTVEGPIKEVIAEFVVLCRNLSNNFDEDILRLALKTGCSKEIDNSELDTAIKYILIVAANKEFEKMQKMKDGADDE